MRLIPLLVLLFGFSTIFVHADELELEGALAAPSRTPEYVARDRYRHPAETLEFFGLRPDMTVVEIWPGAGGWYTARGTAVRRGGAASGSAPYALGGAKAGAVAARSTGSGAGVPACGADAPARDRSARSR